VGEVAGDVPAQKPELHVHGKAQARLGWVAWEDADTVVFCNRRLDDEGRTQGVLGPCYKAGPDNVAHKMISWVMGEAPDTTPANAAPDPDCWIEIEEGALVPKERPARLTWNTHAGRRVLDEWTPDPKLQADRFTLEASFGPGGKYLAVLRVAIGLGDGERTVEIDGARLVPLPACR
jgi:hypothetical protein